MKQKQKILIFPLVLLFIALGMSMTPVAARTFDEWWDDEDWTWATLQRTQYASGSAVVDMAGGAFMYAGAASYDIGHWALAQAQGWFSDDSRDKGPGIYCNSMYEIEYRLNGHLAAYIGNSNGYIKLQIQIRDTDGDGMYYKTVLYEDSYYSTSGWVQFGNYYWSPPTSGTYYFTVYAEAYASGYAGTNRYVSPSVMTITASQYTE